MKHCSVEIVKEPTRDERVREIYQEVFGIQIRQEEDYSKHPSTWLTEARNMDAYKQTHKPDIADPDSERVETNIQSGLIHPRRIVSQPLKQP